MIKEYIELQDAIEEARKSQERLQEILNRMSEDVEGWNEVDIDKAIEVLAKII